MTEELDTFEIKILEQIQKDASLSTTELAEKVGLSQSPCWRRLQRLREDGYIRGEVALLDRKQFGDNIILYATIKTATLSDAKRAEFVRKVELTPEILECYTMFGDRDIMMKVIAKSLDWYQQFVFKILLKLPGVTDVISTVAMTEIKYTTALPVRGRLAL